MLPRATATGEGGVGARRLAGAVAVRRLAVAVAGARGDSGLEDAATISAVSAAGAFDDRVSRCNAARWRINSLILP